MKCRKKAVIEELHPKVQLSSGGYAFDSLGSTMRKTISAPGIGIALSLSE